jgi:hypothetical protein
MKSAELTLKERATHIFSSLLILQRLLRAPCDDDGDWPGTGDRARDLAFWLGIRKLVDDLTEHASILGLVPFPLSEWQRGDGPDDERWRALTDLERREVLGMVAAYENLISWSERTAATIQQSEPLPDRCTIADHLRAERARVLRFRQELRFLERRRAPRDEEDGASAKTQ